MLQVFLADRRMDGTARHGTVWQGNGNWADTQGRRYSLFFFFSCLLALFCIGSGFVTDCSFLLFVF